MAKQGMERFMDVAQFAGPGLIIGNQVRKGRKLKKELDTAIKNRPKYQVAEGYYDNQALAKARAFGKDRGVQMAEEKLDTGASQAIGEAKNITGSTSSLLETLRSITDSTQSQKQNLAIQESQMRDQRLGDLYGANIALGEEQDKAWNYNVNEPYQLKIQELRERRKARQEAMMKLLDVTGTIAGAAVGGPMGASVGSNLGRVAGSAVGTGPVYAPTQI